MRFDKAIVETYFLTKAGSRGEVGGTRVGVEGMCYIRKD